LGDGEQLWKVIAIEDGACFVEVPTIWDEVFAAVIGWEQRAAIRPAGELSYGILISAPPPHPPVR